MPPTPRAPRSTTRARWSETANSSIANKIDDVAAGDVAAGDVAADDVAAGDVAADDVAADDVAADDVAGTSWGAMR